jgi:cell division protein ZapA (FtsZ GTPase activity inhibitor)
VQPPSTSTRAPVVIDVAGQRLRLSGQSDSEHVTALAALVNERFEALQRAGRGAAPAQVLAMLALNLADEVLSERARSQAAQEGQRKAVALAEERAREVEAAARKAIGEALSVIDQALLSDDEQLARRDG